MTTHKDTLSIIIIHKSVCATSWISQCNKISLGPLEKQYCREVYSVFHQKLKARLWMCFNLTLLSCRNTQNEFVFSPTKWTIRVQVKIQDANYLKGLKSIQKYLWSKMLEIQMNSIKNMTPSNNQKYSFLHHCRSAVTFSPNFTILFQSMRFLFSTWQHQFMKYIWLCSWYYIMAIHQILGIFDNTHGTSDCISFLIMVSTFHIIPYGNHFKPI
jgi:hypothetical protein